MYEVNANGREVRFSSMSKAIEFCEEQNEAWLFSESNEEYHFKNGEWQDDASGDADGNTTPQG